MMSDEVEAQGERRLLLVSADWQTRTLVLGELQTRGYDVLALPGSTWGMKALVQHRVEPSAIVMDTKGDAGVTPERVRSLAAMTPDAPLVLLTTAFDRERYESLRPEIAAFCVRPFTVGEIVATIVAVLDESRQGDSE